MAFNASVATLGKKSRNHLALSSSLFHLSLCSVRPPPARLVSLWESLSLAPGAGASPLVELATAVVLALLAGLAMMRLVLIAVSGTISSSASLTNQGSHQTAPNWQAIHERQLLQLREPAANGTWQAEGQGTGRARLGWTPKGDPVRSHKVSPGTGFGAESPRNIPYWLDAAVAALFFVVAALAATGGIGGGGIFVPVLALALKFPPQACVGVSQSLIFGASLGAFIVNAPSRHPTNSERPLIDLGLAAFLAPTEMAGAQVGMLLNHAVPTPIILLVMTVLLSLITFTTLQKGLSQLESERRTKISSYRGPDAVERGRLIVSDDGSIESPRNPSSRVQPPSGPSTTGLYGALVSALAWLLTPAVPAIAKTSSSTIVEIALLIGTWIGLMVLLLIRGGKSMKSLLAFEPCGQEYWAITIVAVISLIGISVLAGRRLVGKEEEHVHLADSPELEPADGDVRWLPHIAAAALARTLLAGIIAGLMGVGGGIVLGPMMLQLGMLPQVSSATTGTMVLLTSSCAATGFILSGVAPLHHSIVFGIVTMLGGCLGKHAFSHLVKKHGCASLIVLLLGGMIGLSMLAVATTGTLDLRRKLLAGTPVEEVFAFHSLCAA